MAKKLYKKGESGNPNGRPKGRKNRSTEEIRSFIQTIVDNNMDNLASDLERMNPTSRWMVIDKLTKYFLPALTKNDNKNENSGEISIVVKYNDDSTDEKQIL